jgi:hypothetical protein
MYPPEKHWMRNTTVQEERPEKTVKEIKRMIIRRWFVASLLFVLLTALALIPWLACAQSCPEGCRCLTVANANDLFGVGNFDMCQTAPCGEEKSPTGATVLKYCIKAKCPEGCSCMTEEKAKEMGYIPCNGQKVSCGYDANKRPLYCFSPAGPCPAECRCLTQEEARKLGYTKFCQDQKKECGKDPGGYPKFCYQIPVAVCPTGCVCLSKEEALAKGLNGNCLDANGNPIVCGAIDADNRYCFKTPEPVRCWYDYNLGKCVGGCSAGKKCQLNTIYRDPKTMKVTFAECHCK